MIDETIVVCDICKKYPENNCRHPCCKNNKKLKAELQKLKGAEE